MRNPGKGRILIIDDDVDFREMLRALLSAEDYAPEVAEDAVEGGKALLAERPDLILCDLKMPYMNGLELLSLLRADPNTSALPVILVSGQNDIDVLGKAVQLGASDFLIKPITRERLLKSLEACLQKVRGGDLSHEPELKQPPH